ncbi:unnamed protein product [Linum tenue]|uniref:FAS1 domain-containing protein n=2 Tax=Linum tenue TaxID=586396 RepID=A0AAV0LXG6_9ROSI|nr:unnamed protein product [Linum tenue]
METQNWLFFAAVCLLSISSASAAGGSFNITETLAKYSDYNQFNQLLSQTGLADDINNLGTATVLVVNDGGAGSISGQSKQVIKNTLMLNVIMDYLDSNKIKSWKRRSVTFTTMYQRTGEASGDQGQINITKSDNNQVQFGNGGADAQLTATMQKVVTAVSPLSVIEISNLIQPQWIYNKKASSPKKAPSPSPSDAPAPSRRHRKEAPQSAESPEADSPPQPDADAESSDTPAAAPGGAHSAASSPSAPAAACAVLLGLMAFATGF